MAFLKKGGWVIPCVYPFSFFVMLYVCIHSVEWCFLLKRESVFITKLSLEFFSKCCQVSFCKIKNLEYFADVCACPPFMSLQLNRQRVFDRFKTRENTFFDKLEDDLFQSLFEMKEYAHKTYLLAMKWGIGTVKMELWRSHANFIQRIIDNVAYRSHGWAARELKAHFGGEEDLSKSENKAAKRIIREASRPHDSMIGMPQQHMGMAWSPQFIPPPHDGYEHAHSVLSNTSANAKSSADAKPCRSSYFIWRSLF